MAEPTRAPGSPPRAHTTPRTLPRALAAGGWGREFALDLLAILWPTSCAGCGFPDRELCRECLRQLHDLPMRLAGDQQSTPYPASAGVQRDENPGPARFVAGPYTGIVRAMLVAFKHGGSYGFRTHLGRRLGGVLTDASEVARLHAVSVGSAALPPMLVTVPSRAARIRERGYRPVDVLVDVALRDTGILAIRVRGLKALRGRTGQVGLDAAARQRNAALLYVPGRAATQLRGRSVILIDDIITSGATVSAATRALEQAGARVVAVVALCAVARRDLPEDAPRQAS